MKPNIKPLKYCTPRMLEQLGEAKKGNQVATMTYWPLRARGWIDAKGVITQKGIDYLIKRGYS